MDEPIPLEAALVAGVCLVLGAIAIAVVVRRAASGRMGPNPWAGIRTPTVQRSPETWRVGHLAARGPTDIGAAGMALSGLAAPFLHDGVAFTVVAIGGSAWGVAWLIIGAARASSAARAVAPLGRGGTRLD
ncbi:SdpI family protein [Actinotalea subterranea]|uniref:SdpI family protein n=1 Tax=Actinotalea subterranea TaxID=2607497 RepID=UPI0011EE1D63|nr:SdpI family protein [Actinotalea subterranea]